MVQLIAFYGFGELSTRTVIILKEVTDFLRMLGFKITVSYIRVPLLDEEAPPTIAVGAQSHIVSSREDLEEAITLILSAVLGQYGFGEQEEPKTHHMQIFSMHKRTYNVYVEAVT